MSPKDFQLHNGKKGAALAIRLTPRSSRNEIAEIMNDGTIRIRLTAPLHGGQINSALVSFLAQILDISPSRIDVVAGETGKDKIVSILDLDAEEVHQRILRSL
jgi:hypothetical protein